MADEDGKNTSLADVIVKHLRDPDRKDGAKGHKKHSKREQKKKNEDRDCIAVHSRQVHPPILNTKFGATGFDVAPKFPGKPKLGEKVCQGTIASWLNWCRISTIGRLSPH